MEDHEQMKYRASIDLCGRRSEAGFALVVVLGTITSMIIGFLSPYVIAMI